MQDTVHYTQCPLCGSIQIRKALDTKDYSISKEAFSLYECADCSFRFTQDIPGPESIGRYYQSEDYISHSDTRKGVINTLYHYARNYMLGAKRKLIQRLSADKRLLDVGCGTGYFIHHMQEHGYDVLGIEVDAGARAFAKTEFDLEILPPDELVAGKIEGPFGIISMWHVLEHVHDPDQYLQRLHELLTDNGVLMIAVPNYTSLDGQRYQGYWAAYDVPRHLWHFSPATLQQIADKNGFKLIDKKRLPLDPFYVSMLSEKYKGRGAVGLIRAAFSGLRSHLKSLGNIDRSSSLVYILRKA